MAKQCRKCGGEILSDIERLNRSVVEQADSEHRARLQENVDRYMRPGQVIEDEAWIRGFRAGALGQLDELEQTYDRMLERVRADKADGEDDS